MSKLKKGHKALIIVAAVILTLALVALIVYLAVFRQDPEQPIGYDKIALENYVGENNNKDYYIAVNSYDDDFKAIGSVSLKKVFKTKDGATFAIGDSSLGTINGDILTKMKEGETTLTIKEGGENRTVNLIILNGINVFNQKEFVYGCVVNVDTEFAVVIHDKILLEKRNPVEYDVFLPDSSSLGDRTVPVFHDIYGNSNIISAEGLSKDYREDDDSKNDLDMGSVLELMATENDFVIRDCMIMGMELENGVEIFLSDSEKLGTLVDINQGNDVTIINCLIENGAKLVSISGSDVRIEGSVIRYAGDTCVSVGTKPDMTSNVTLKNNVYGDAVVAAIVNYCIDGWNSSADYPTFNLEGFNDFYNWRALGNVRVMPGAEPLADVVNPIVSGKIGEIKEEEEDRVITVGEVEYVHLAFVVLSSSSGKVNTPNINGLETAKISKTAFPLPGVAYQFITNLDMIGYSGTIDTVPVKPGALMSENIDQLIKDLQFGRK